ncbi:hypothetical protein JOC70_000778 [Clostridium pascui]|uniref:hypothetical protein n=1 Tax=Clostridium pascui TaxID=46609 RepID=UPI0019587443|nr:hypothetical protein [Clostridium pascui]MBM7869309.1 hypothetical protein [Clostridium pascui]
MMIVDERYEITRKLARVFEPYIVMGNARDYLEATIREDAPQNAKDAHKEYIKITNKILEDRAKSIFS